MRSGAALERCDPSALRSSKAGTWSGGVRGPRWRRPAGGRCCPWHFLQGVSLLAFRGVSCQESGWLVLSVCWQRKCRVLRERAPGHAHCHLRVVGGWPSVASLGVLDCDDRASMSIHPLSGSVKREGRKVCTHAQVCTRVVNGRVYVHTCTHACACLYVCTAKAQCSQCMTS